MSDRLSMTPTQLMGDPAHMIAWLKILPPQHVVSECMVQADRCLGARFLHAHGHTDARVMFDYGYRVSRIDGDLTSSPIVGSNFHVHPILEKALLRMADLEDDTPITVARALRAITWAKRQHGRKS